MKNVYKFVSWEVDPLDKQKDLNHYKLLEKLNEGKTLTRAEKNSLNLNEYCGVKRYLGYAFDFRPFLKTFWVKLRNRGIEEVYAFDKTHVRTQLHAEYVSNYQILKIVEIN